MDRVERVHRLHALLSKFRIPISPGGICERLECSASTAKRLIRDMRLYLDAPIINQPGAGYSYARNSTFELPGIWFSPEELYALLHRQRMHIRYHGRQREAQTERIKQARLLESDCKHVADAELDKVLAHSFGMFSGEPTAMAVLRFSEYAARWVRDEEWFPDQETVELVDGGLELRIPYHNPTELIMEICRYGDQVEVIKPPELRKQVADVLRKAADQYR